MKSLHHHRRQVLLGLLVLVGAGALYLVTVDQNRARQVSINQAQKNLPSTTEGSQADRIPKPGVYEYRGTGVDRLSLPPLSQKQGPTIPGSVVLLDNGCWRFRVDFSTNHWQTWTYCRHGADVRETGGKSGQRWMVGPKGFTNTSDFSCKPVITSLPAARRPGQKWTENCSGTSTAVKGVGVSTGPYRFAGDEDLTIGGITVRTAHFLRSRTLTQAQRGTEVTDLWYDVGSGLVIRNRRRVRVKTDTIIGTSTYTETGEFVLQSLTPRAS